MRIKPESIAHLARLRAALPRHRVSPLASSELDVHINGLLAEYELLHRFRNEGKDPVEAVYSFPIPLDAAFLGMEAEIDGVKRVAQVQPATSARETFDDAIAEGDSAVLLERLEPGLLCVDLGNLMPGEDGVVVLRFAATLQVAGGTARFSLPLVQRPRYGRSRLDSAADIRHDFAVEHPLEARIRVSGLLAGAAVHCATHAVKFRHEAEDLVLEIGHAHLDRDLVLGFEPQEDAEPELRCIQDGDGAIAMVHWVLPEAAGEGQAMDLCLVLDGSGSMNGDAIAQSRAALAAVASHLRDEDRIQVLRFGSRTVPLFRRPLRATERVRSALQELTATVNADLGGTEMADALEEALHGLQALDGTGRAQAIVLVTDGAVQPYELEGIQGLAADVGIRIFVVAVGSSAGVDALMPLAETTRGGLERAVPAEPIDAGVMRHLQRARQEPVQVRVDWGGSERVLPLPTAYPGDAVTAIAFFEDAQMEGRSVSIGAGASDAAHVLQLVAPKNSPAWRAWAGQHAYRHAGDEERAELALAYGLITEETSAVLVRERAAGEKAQGLPQVVPVAHMVPGGTVFMQSIRRADIVDMAIPTSLMKRSWSLERSVGTRSLYRKMYQEDRDFSDLEPAKPPLSAERIAAVRIALREALDVLLLGDTEQPADFNAVLGLIDPKLHECVKRYLREEGISLTSPSEAWRLLGHLADLSSGQPLSDEEEVLLALNCPDFGKVRSGSDE